MKFRFLKDSFRIKPGHKYKITGYERRTLAVYQTRWLPLIRRRWMGKQIVAIRITRYPWKLYTREFIAPGPVIIAPQLAAGMTEFDNIRVYDDEYRAGRMKMFLTMAKDLFGL